MPKKADIKKLREAGLLSGSYERYRCLYAAFLKERRKGKSKLQSIHDAGDKKGASDRTMYNAIKACQRLK